MGKIRGEKKEGVVEALNLPRRLIKKEVNLAI